MTDRLEIVPTTLKAAHMWVDRAHRHHKAPQGGLFAVAVARGPEIVGVAIVGRPVNLHRADGWTVEVTRVAVIDGQPNACSKLYAAAWRAARAMGYRKAITYTLEEEKGTSVKSAGWKCIASVRGRSWNTPSRPRIDEHPLQDKFRWETAICSTPGRGSLCNRAR